MRMNNKVWIIGLMILIVATMAFYTYGVAGQGTITQGVAEQYTSTNSGDFTIIGGGETTVNINAQFQSVNWIGFYGTISGDIYLGDSVNTLYNWNFPFTSGAVYASTLSSINWSTASAGTLASDTQLSNDESETFTGTKNWNIGTITVNNAPMVQLYNSTSAGVWDEISLDVTSGEVFGTEIQKNGNCFNNQVCDFEMIVPGVSGQATTYYFYVELE